MNLSENAYYTYLVAYTISDDKMEEKFRTFLTDGYEKKGLNAKKVDQSTYGTKNVRELSILLSFLENKLKEIKDQEKKVFNKEDYVRVFCSAVRAEDVDNGHFVYQYNVKLS